MPCADARPHRGGVGRLIHRAVDQPAAALAGADDEPAVLLEPLVEEPLDEPLEEPPDDPLDDPFDPDEESLEEPLSEEPDDSLLDEAAFGPLLLDRLSVL